MGIPGLVTQFQVAQQVWNSHRRTVLVKKTFFPIHVILCMILIQGGATLTFDVRLVRLNNAVWSDEVDIIRLRNKNI